MMKCCIFTLIGGNDNYGAELQNYAVQQILKKIGCYSETFFSQTRGEKRIAVIKILLYDYLKKGMGKSYGKYYKRRRKFEYFRKNYINISQYNKYVLNNINSLYDYFVVGSDQVWNPLYNSFSNTMMLTFADNNKKIAFCASVGIDEIPEEKEEIFKKNLPLFNAISVREKQAEKLLQQYCRKKIVTLCDPTLMLRKKEWEKIAVKPYAQMPSKYILSYFLGKMSEEKKNQIEFLMKTHGYTLIDVSPYLSSRVNKEDSSYYDIGPLEFIWLVFNAEIVCTDSFHGFAFSCIGERKVRVFQREDTLNMEGRIIGLANELGYNLKYGKEFCVDSRVLADFCKTKIDAAENFLRQSMRK